MPHKNAEEFYNSLRRNNFTRNIRRTVENGILKIEYETTNSDGAQAGLVAGMLGGAVLGPVAAITGGIGYVVGSKFDTWTTRTAYFNNSTGVFLATSCNEAARKCNEIGLEQFRQLNFNEAEEWFNKAYHTCEKHYSEEDQFKEHRKLAKIAAKAELMLNEGSYAPAVTEFQTALDTATDEDLCKVLGDRIAHAKQKQNEAAINFNQKGVELFQRGEFAEALQNFNDACNSCTLDCVYVDEYVSNKSVAEIMLEGQVMLDRGEYAAAIRKFQEANRQDYINLVKDKQNEIAANFYDQGFNSFREGGFTGASECFESAYHTCADDCASKSKYLNARNIANIVAEAECMLNEGKYASALSELQLAWSMSDDVDIWRVIEDRIAQAEQKQNEAASNFNQRGIELLQSGKFAEALQHFKDACNSCTVDCVYINEYISNMSVADVMLEGHVMFNRGEYAAAIGRFEEANRQDYIDLVKDKQNESAANFYRQGLKLFNDNAPTEASQCFEKAYNSCADDCTSKSKYLNARNIANIASEAQAMFNKKKFDAAITMFKEACELAHDAEIKNRISVYIFETNIAKAEDVWEQGKLEWDSAWADENGNVVEANTKFQKANCYFSEALSIKPSITKYQNWQEASRLKIEGNKLFNQGIKLFEDSHLQEALSKLRMAHDQFQLGFRATQDTKFSECVSYVESHIQKYKEIGEVEEINKAMKAVVVGIPASTSRSELEKESLLEDQVDMKSNNSYLSRQVDSVRNGSC